MRLKHSSKQAFTKKNDSRKKVSRNTPKQAFLTFFYSSPRLTKIGLTGLNGLLYLIEKTPFLRDIIPLTDPAKNNMTYLAINKNIAVEAPKIIPVHEHLDGPVNKTVPRQILDDMIDVFSFHVIMDKCICRLGFQCENFTNDVGCLFMGESAKKLPPGLGRRVDRKQAHEHVLRAVALGLVPMTGKVYVDNLGFLIRDTKELFSVCFCCHCCCMMGYYKHSPDHLKKIFKPMEGLRVRVNQNCTGCGLCLETCIFDGIVIKDGVAHHLDHCVGCGRCQTTCPNNAIDIFVSNPDYAEKVKNRLTSFITIS